MKKVVDNPYKIEYNKRVVRNRKEKTHNEN